MASVSVSHLVLFIASLLIAASVAGTLVTGVDSLSDAFSDQSLRTSDSIETDISIISDTGSDRMYDGTNVSVLVKNTGATTLPPDVDRIDILVDGVFIPSENATVEVIDGSAAHEWASSEVVRINVTRNLDLGEHRVSISVQGSEDVVTFRVT